MISAYRKVRHQIRFMLLLCGALFAAGAYLQTPRAVHTPTDFSVRASSFVPAAPAISVYDGDTIRIGKERIRLVGFDTPELGDRARCAREAQDAAHARDFLSTAINRGQDVRIERDGLDRYGRTLGRLYIDGADASALMIDAGHGRSYSGGYRAGWC
ncbi:MAG: thermonuclease family protein [Parvibaculum sp.]|uniref:thermonuclease family protein n=1 Tax=Parvibaculum sp. TaxID=2024848 RepID=UPI0034A0A9C5